LLINNLLIHLLIIYYPFHLIRPLFIAWNRLKPFEQFAVCSETVFWTLNRLVTSKVHYMEKNPGIFSSKTLISFRQKQERHGYLGWHGGE